eukprot:TRINITY_DN38016_c0_g1_i1.p1 TRINITY_DN38016_c0_g1~~TRINITY_DN38016_c0_g1_i1.p1  ORF type:complete len:374 (+),score=84.16 TRINITY_DN38016_c0_g1_i1:48-1124(+)
MAYVFVANFSPAGWALGRWSQVSATEWVESKLDDEAVCYKFDTVEMPSAAAWPRSVKCLRMQDCPTTEVLLLDGSAQIFVNGGYFGEFKGHWEEDPSPPYVPGEDGALDETLPPTEVTMLHAPGEPSAPTVQVFKGAGRPRRHSKMNASPAMVQALHQACAAGDVEKAKDLLEKGVASECVPPGEDTSPLVAAVLGGHLQVVRALLQAGADPSFGAGENLPMTAAFKKGDKQILSELFASSLQTLGSAVEGHGSHGGSASRLAAATAATMEAPGTAAEDLRNATSKLASMGTSNLLRPGSKGGNVKPLDMSYSLDIGQEERLERNHCVEVAMKQIARAATPSPKSPSSRGKLINEGPL